MKITWLAILLFPVTVFSQKDICPCTFKGFVSAGAIGGQSEVKPLFQLSGGLSYDGDDFYTGIGVGLDPYRFNSIPVFADWRMNFGRNNIGFVYGNIGYNIPYNNKSNDAGVNIFKVKDRINGGVYTDAGAGFRFPMGKRNWLAVSAGFSFKQVYNLTAYIYPWCTNCEAEKYTYRYDLSRMVVKFSWELGK